MNGIHGYLSIRDASYKWGVSERRVNQYCVQGRIPGLTRFGRSWAVLGDTGRREEAARPTKEFGEAEVTDWRYGF